MRQFFYGDQVTAYDSFRREWVTGVVIDRLPCLWLFTQYMVRFDGNTYNTDWYIWWKLFPKFPEQVKDVPP